MNFKLELIDYIKDPLASLTKVPPTSPFYLDSVCRILRRAIELPSDPKQLNDVTQNINEPPPTPALKISQ
jgi:hypothetical protein